MKKIILLSILILMGCVAFAQEQIKVMSFNIHGSINTPIEKIAEFIVANKPDIVAIQEIEFYTDRSVQANARSHNNNEDMITKLAYMCKMQGMFYPAINVYGGSFGNAILSRFPIERTEKVLLPFAENTEQRVAAISDLKLPNGEMFTLICTHLDMADQDNGMNQIKKINEIGKAAKYPIILAGDMNKRLDTPHINELKSVWSLSLSHEFDHIAQFPGDKFTVTDTKVFTENTLSDHLPIMVTYKLNK